MSLKRPNRRCGLSIKNAGDRVMLDRQQSRRLMPAPIVSVSAAPQAATNKPHKAGSYNPLYEGTARIHAVSGRGYYSAPPRGY